nr:MAG TPA: hypothetical protein [Caudoviricetes sp.]
MIIFPLLFNLNYYYFTPDVKTLCKEKHNLRFNKICL